MTTEYFPRPVGEPHVHHFNAEAQTTPGRNRNTLLCAAATSTPFVLTLIQEQLHLKLEAMILPLDMVIVEKAERTPTEN